MKKTVFPVILAIVLCLSMFGCMKASPEAVAKKVEKYAEINQSSLDELNEQFEGVMHYALEAEGMNLIYRFDALMAGAVTESSCRSIVNKSGEDYKTIFDHLKTYARSDEVKLILRFYDEKGALVFEQYVDKDFTVDPDQTEAKSDLSSLESYINGDDFQSQMAANSTDEIAVRASVEDGNTVVITYAFTTELDRSALDLLRAGWDESFGGGETAESMGSTLKALQAIFPDDNVVLKVRITDTTEEILWEKTYE